MFVTPPLGWFGGAPFLAFGAFVLTLALTLAFAFLSLSASHWEDSVINV